jgi:DNA-binding beta-propeller fold protein YncE
MVKASFVRDIRNSSTNEHARKLGLSISVSNGIFRLRYLLTSVDNSESAGTSLAVYAYSYTKVFRKERKPMRTLFVLLGVSSLCLVSVKADLVTISLDSTSILRYDENSGAFLGVLVPAGSGGLNSPRGLCYGANGDLYVTDLLSNSVLRYRGSDGSFVGVFVPSGYGGLSGPRNLTFGPDGHLYVVSRDTDSVLRYDGTTGAFLGAFVSSRSGGLDNPVDLAFGPDGHLYVSSINTNSVLRYDGATGAFKGVFASGGGLSSPRGLAFGQDGDLYVVSQTTNNVLRYDGTTGAFKGVFASGGGLAMPIGLAFGPDGHLYVGTRSGNILRYHGVSGAFLDIFIPAGRGGLGGSAFLTFTPRRIHGEVILRDFVGNPASVSVILELRRHDDATAIEVRRISPDSTGRYALLVTRTGRYDISAKASHWLRQTVRNVLLQPETSLNFTLINGDIDNDNEVTLFDFGRLVAAFGAVPGDSNWNPDADLDGDEEVTLFDFGVLVRNFGLIGDD